MIDCSLAKSCRGGFECCGIFPINDEVINKFPPSDKYIKKAISSNGITIIETIDDLCVYLDRNNGLCTIYEHRPKICRVYGTVEGLLCCHIRPDGVIRSRSERREIKRNTLLIARASLKKLQKTLRSVGKDALMNDTEWQDFIGCLK